VYCALSLTSRCCKESSSASILSFDTDDIEGNLERIAHVNSSFFWHLPALSSANTVGNPPVVIVHAKGNDRRCQFYNANITRALTIILAVSFD
jgi:hypothetical protein